MIPAMSVDVRYCTTKDGVQIAAKSGQGEILASDVVRGLCSGMGFLFADHGKFTAEGFEEPVHLYEISWRA